IQSLWIIRTGADQAVVSRRDRRKDPPERRLMHIIGEDLLIAGTDECSPIARLLTMGCSEGNCPLPGQIAIGFCRLLCLRRQGNANDQAETHPPYQSADRAR